MAIKTARELAALCEEVARNYKTMYIKGCFGAPMTARNKLRYTTNYDYNKEHAEEINAASEDTFGFDCVCFIKGLLWGWCGDPSAIYGGAEYKSNGVPDIGTSGILSVCTEVSEDFTEIQIGELLWMPGHVGIYIGGGLAVEATAAWEGKVLISAVMNIGEKDGYHSRSWTKHGKLPYVEYEAEPQTETQETHALLYLPVLRRGDKREQVRALQALLIGYGYNCGDSGVDGSFGPATEEAVKAFRFANGLEKLGLVDAKVWARLTAAEGACAVLRVE